MPIRHKYVDIFQWHFQVSFTVITLFDVARCRTCNFDQKLEHRCFPNIDRTQAAPSTIYCNALHAADETIQSLPGVMGVHSEFFVLVTLTFDLWPWHSNSSKRWTKHVFTVNLAQIRSAVPEIFDPQAKNKVTDSAKNRTLVHCVR